MEINEIKERIMRLENSINEREKEKQEIYNKNKSRTIHIFPKEDRVKLKLINELDLLSLSLIEVYKHLEEKKGE